MFCSHCGEPLETEELGFQPGGYYRFELNCLGCGARFFAVVDEDTEMIALRQVMKGRRMTSENWDRFLS